MLARNPQQMVHSSVMTCLHQSMRRLETLSTRSSFPTSECRHGIDDETMGGMECSL